MHQIFLFLLNIQFIYSLTWNGNVDTFPTSWKVTRISNQELLSIVNDPLNSAQKVIKIKHPKGSCSSACGIPGGAGFNVLPFDNFNGNISTLQYEVFFHSTFNFVKSGKLIGMYGGSTGCSGCNDDVTSRTNCFSARICWGKEGNGYPYLYLPLNVNHEAEFCSLANGGTCTAGCGLGFNQTRYFERNKWTQIKEHIKLNTPGKNDGVLQVWVNGDKKIDYRKMNFRTKLSVGIKGFVFHPFFGGSGDSFATPVDTYTMFKNFKFADYLF